MRIADNIEMLEIKMDHGTLYPVLIWDDNELILIDTGLSGQIDLFRDEILRAGFSIEAITKVIITHQDVDHIGCAKIFADFGAKIIAHIDEIPYIQGEKTPIKISDKEERLQELNEREYAFYERSKDNAPLLYLSVDISVEDNQILDICGGIQIIHTPGHTPGHISLLLKKSGILIAGDAANIKEGKLIGANSGPQYTHNFALSEVSFNKMIGLNPSAVVCYHGGIIHLK